MLYMLQVVSIGKDATDDNINPIVIAAIAALKHSTAEVGHPAYSSVFKCSDPVEQEDAAAAAKDAAAAVEQKQKYIQKEKVDEPEVQSDLCREVQLLIADQLEKATKVASMMSTAKLSNANTLSQVACEFVP